MNKLQNEAMDELNNE